MSLPVQPPLPLVELSVLRAEPQLASLPHVADLVSAFLDVSPRFTLVEAAASGSPRLFDRVLARVRNDPEIDADLVAYWLARSMETAIRRDDLAMNGSLEMVQRVVGNRSDGQCRPPGIQSLCGSCLAAALKHVGSQGARRVVQWLLDAGCPLGSATEKRTVYAAVSNTLRTSVALVEWFYEQKWLTTDVAARILSAAIENGPPESVSVVDFLLTHGYSLSKPNTIASLMRGCCQRQLEPIVERVVASPPCDPFRDKLVYAPTRPGGAKVLQWDVVFMAETCVYGTSSLSSQLGFYAAQFGHTDMVRWLYEVHDIINLDISLRLVQDQGALLELYQWMHDADVSDTWPWDDKVAAARRWTPQTMDAAAWRGHLDVVEWLHANRTEGCTDLALKHAAGNGHLVVVQWLAERRQEGNTNIAMTTAAVAGHLEVVAWLLENRPGGCVSCVLGDIVREPHRYANPKPTVLDCLAWLRTRNESAANCEGRCLPSRAARLRPPASDLFTHAVRTGDLSLAKSLLTHHHHQFVIDLPASACEAARGGHGPVLEWMRDALRGHEGWGEAFP